MTRYPKELHMPDTRLEELLESVSRDGTARDSGEAIVAEQLSKRYPNGTDAVRGVSFRVRTGEVFGILGPNGAGKSTTMGLLGTLVQPTGGRASVAGYDISKRPQEVRRRIGFTMQDVGGEEGDKSSRDRGGEDRLAATHSFDGANDVLWVAVLEQIAARARVQGGDRVAGCVGGEDDDTDVWASREDLRVVMIPFRSGKWISITTTSGSKVFACCTASPPVAASPATSMPGEASITARTALRKGA
jgi:hypothetical protein